MGRGEPLVVGEVQAVELAVGDRPYLRRSRHAVEERELSDNSAGVDLGDGAEAVTAENSGHLEHARDEEVKRPLRSLFADEDVAARNADSVRVREERLPVRLPPAGDREEGL